jgi:hypothetical protein
VLTHGTRRILLGSASLFKTDFEALATAVGGTAGDAMQHTRASFATTTLLMSQQPCFCRQRFINACCPQKMRGFG